MSLDNIQLPPFLVGELYKNFLVDIDNQQLNPGLSETGNLSYLGKNEKNILLIVREKNALYLSDENLHFLVGILNACKLTLTDTALLNVHERNDIKYNMLLEKFKPGIILFFGIEPASLEFPLQFPLYQLQKYNNQTYLSAPSLDELAADIEKKKLFWASLRKLFSV